jgi:hypothetical protein
VSSFCRLEVLFDAPALPGHANEAGQRRPVRAVAAQVGQLARGVVAADQQVVLGGVVLGFGQQRDPGPGVVAGAFAARPGRMLLPCVAGPGCGELVDARHAGVGGHAAVGGDLQHVAQPEPAHGGAQGRVGAVDLITGHPGSGDTGVDRAGDHRGGERGLGRELDVGGHARGGAPIRVVGPRGRQVQARSINACPRRAA